MTQPATTVPEPLDYQAVFAAVPGLYLILRPDLIILEASDAYLRATMTTREGIVGRHLFDVFPDNPADPDSTGTHHLGASLSRVLAQGIPDTMAVQKYDVRRPDGEGGGFEARYWSPQNLPVLGPDGQVRYLVHRVEDVTEFVRLKQADTEQQRLTAELQSRAGMMEAEVIARSQELQAANARLRQVNEALVDRDAERTRLYDRLYELDQVKTRFFANASHELRTPLTLILGPLRRLLAGGDLSAAARTELAVVQRNASVLLDLVNDLLDIAKLDAGKLRARYADGDVAGLLRLVAAHFDSAVADRQIALTVEAPEVLPAQVDPDKVQRLLVNLLANAIRFTPAGGRVRLTARAEAGDAGARVVLEVADSGPGVPPTARETVFERFAQADPGGNRPQSGTGLGLAIVREFAELHRGSVGLGDAPEGGALFTVTLPRQAPSGSEVHAPGGPTAIADVVMPEVPTVTEAGPQGDHDGAGEDRGLVLVVEDNGELRAHISQVLQDRFRVVTAADGLAGLEAARHHRPDLIISDVMMPGLSGPEMVRQLRQGPESAATPVLMLTAKADDDLRVQLLATEVQDFLTKPFLAEELLARVTNLVTMQRGLTLLAHQGEQLRETTERLADANGELEAFSYSVAHDLRAPLRSLSGFSQALLEDYGDRLDGDGQDYLRRIAAAAQRMGALIDDLLRLSQVSRSPIRREPVDLSALAGRVVATLRQAQPDRRIAVRIADGLSTHGDAHLWGIVLDNLLGNAWKFTTKRDDATIVVEQRQVDGQEVFAIADNGAGFDMAYADKLFHPFQRLHGNDEFAGTGIGLATVQRILRRHGGRIWAEAAPDRGATFYLAPQQTIAP
jgi:signal transduction histidine kinase